MSAIVVVGATSTMAKATVQKLGAKGRNLVLAGRRVDELETMKTDLEIRYDIDVWVKPFEAVSYDTHASFWQDCIDTTGGVDGILLMYGTMPDQKVAEQDFDVAKQMIDVNYTSAVSILNIAANYFEEKQRGFICAVSSVAGDRGRKSNYIYGSTKAGLSTYLQGLRNRLHGSNVQVLTIKPGIIDTKMTHGVVEPGPLMGQPETVASDIVRGLSKKKDVMYTPWFWFVIMFVIKVIPEKLFKRTDL